MRRWFGLVGIVGACTGEVPVPVDTDTDTDESPPVDTDVYETGTEQVDTDTDLTDDTDSGGETETDSETGDTGLVAGDTALCIFGEIPDCSGTCFPKYFLGDGVCDDGLTTMSDFSCVSYRLDEGDCGEIGPGPDSCEYVMRLVTRGYENEIGWRLLDEQGVTLYRVTPGTYTDGLRTYDHPIELADGTFTMVMVDSWGDGWNQGRWELVRPTSGEIIASGSLQDDPEEPDLAPIVQEEEVPFTVACASATAPECDLTMMLASGTNGGEIAWELRASSGYVLYDSAAGALGDNQQITDTIRLATGNYTFRMTDAGRNGWQGGHVEMAYAGGYVAGVGTLTGFQVGSFQLGVDCAQENEPPIPSPTEVFPINCAETQLVIAAEADGPELGFTLYDAGNWSQITSRDPGVFFGNVQSIIGAPLPRSGRYALVPRDSIGNGWAGSTITVRDRSTMTDLTTATLPYGFSTLMTFDVECTDQVVDTAPPVVGPCPEGAIEDCNGVCWPAVFVGDCHCDDGVQFAANFLCPEHGSDLGDCTVPLPRRCRE